MIGIFDSGIGGFHALQNLLWQKPDLSFAYLADHAFLPYGEKKSHAIAIRVKKGVEWLKRQGADQILIACHTASLAAVEFFDEGMVPLAKKAIDAIPSHFSSALLIGTKATIHSGIYRMMLEKRNLSVKERACPELVTLVEMCFSMDKTEMKKKIRETLPLRHTKEALFLACTHFSFLKPYLEDGFFIVDPSNYLGLSLSDGKPHAQKAFYTTGCDLESFKHQIDCFFPELEVFSCSKIEKELLQEKQKGQEKRFPEKYRALALSNEIAYAQAHIQNASF